MVKLEQIGATVVASLTVHLVAILWFGWAVKCRSTHVAPRCEARPRNVIYNPDPFCDVQNRGNPWLGWVPWVLKLSYEDMLSGVPGTGTRDSGLSGSMLRVNMDNIVMLRFHSFGLRVTTVGFLVYTLILLPLYWTAGCAALDEADDNANLQAHCTNLTNYDWTTIANIVPETDIRSTELVGLSIRLYIVVFCSWFVTWYACYELKQEWVDILAMRRYHFLESDHWKSRQEDFEQTVMSQRSDDEMQETSAQRKTRQRTRKKKFKSEPDFLRDRDPWIPHPELRDTPPSIALYSVLVGGIPSKPAATQDEEGHDIEAPQNDENANREWQLSVTSAFFDHCIPNQPGFSSSVAAVTILPHANELANSWRKWYAAAKKLRRLRFIRKQIRMKRHYEIEVDSDDDYYDDEESLKRSVSPPNLHRSSTSGSAYNDDTAAPRANYNREVFGSAMDDDVEELFLEAMEFGPEQTAVYSREFAQSAAPCCPNGCFEGAVVQARIDELLDLEQIALEEVELANLELEAARQNAVLNARAKDLEKGNKSKESKNKSKSNHEDDNKEKASRGKSIAIIGGGEIPLDLGVAKVKNLIEHDTVQNLMGTEKRAVNRTLNSERKFDLEAKLLQRERSGYLLSDASSSSSSSNGEQENRARNRKRAARPRSPSRPREISARPEQHLAPVPTYDDSDPTPFRDSKDRPIQQKRKTFHMEDPNNQHNSSTAHRRRHYSYSEATTRPDTTEQSRHSKVSILRRQSIRQSSASYTVHNPSDAWALVDAIALDSQEHGALGSDEANEKTSRVVSAGNWELSSLTDFLKMLVSGVQKLLRWTTAKSNEAVDLVAQDTTYAVVTFTSRQAAVAARKVLADGRGSTRWVQLDTLPIPPLADAAACDLLTCRGCCRPVTMSINDRQKKWRSWVSLAALGTIYFFYTFPLTWVGSYANSKNLTELFPGLKDLQDTFFSAELLSSMIGALLWAAFLAVCPVLFKIIANFGSNANSNVEAEFSALKYFWWFMVVSAFSGTLLQQMLLEGFNGGVRIGAELQEVMRTIAATIPTEVSPQWISWIIVKTSVTAPFMYMLQLNSFLFDWLQLKCCLRAVRGGGPGGPLPYRIYVDSGVVLLCLFALAPAAPLVAPFAFLYFLLSTPMLRRNVIFMYRPKFDAGGIRFPFLFEMCISSIFVGQVLLSTMMGLKKSLGPSVLAAAAFVPTLLFRDAMRDRYLRAFNDVGLLQTSLLDGWDMASPESQEKREERRRFLVDSHKAGYVPVCVASTLTDEVLTAEPAVVVPTIAETEAELNQSLTTVRFDQASVADPMNDVSSRTEMSKRGRFRLPGHQPGATLRRASRVVTSHAMPSGMERAEDLGDQQDCIGETHQSIGDLSFYDCISESDKEK